MDRRTDEEIIEDLLLICEELGWDIEIPMGENQDTSMPNVDGLVIGTEGFIKRVLGASNPANSIKNSDLINSQDELSDTSVDDNVVSITGRKKTPPVH